MQDGRLRRIRFIALLPESVLTATDRKRGSGHVPHDRRSVSSAVPGLTAILPARRPGIRRCAGAAGRGLGGTGGVSNRDGTDHLPAAVGRNRSVSLQTCSIDAAVDRVDVHVRRIADPDHRDLVADHEAVDRGCTRETAAGQPCPSSVRRVSLVEPRRGPSARAPRPQLTRARRLTALASWSGMRSAREISATWGAIARTPSSLSIRW